MADKNSVYRTFDDTTLLQAAKNDPQGFVKLIKGTRTVIKIFAPKIRD